MLLRFNWISNHSKKLLLVGTVVVSSRLHERPWETHGGGVHVVRIISLAFDAISSQLFFFPTQRLKQARTTNMNDHFQWKLWEGMDCVGRDSAEMPRPRGAAAGRTLVGGGGGGVDAGDGEAARSCLRVYLDR